MYVQLMHDALDDQSGPEAPKAVLLARLAQCRGALKRRDAQTVSTDPAAEVLMDHLTYDVALVRFARQVGIETELELFHMPYLERTRLEGALADRGYEFKP